MTISILGRSTQGVTLMRTNEGKVVSIETINPDDSPLKQCYNTCRERIKRKVIIYLSF